MLESAVQRIENKGLSGLVGSTANFMAYYGVQAAEEGAVSAVGAMVGGVAGGIAGAAAGQFVKGSIAGAGVARNPYNAMLYDSPAFRDHTFNWKFIARNSAEVEMLRVVIQRLKLAAAPSMNGKNPHFFDYPQLFDVDFHYPQYLFNMGPSVCKTIDVNYHAEGQPLYFDIPGQIGENQVTKKAPVSITLSMALTEMFIITKESIKGQQR
jgi:hypothetical protein